MAIERITRVAGRAVPVRGDNIDTDRIIPARFLRSVSFEGLEQGLFADDRAQADAVRPQSHPISNPRFAGASVMLVNANFGCGSSREHAPQAIRRHGIRAIVGQSFSEIFFGNSVALGMPCVTVGAAEAEELMRRVEADPALEVAIDLEAMTVSAGDLRVSSALAAAAREAFLDGSWDATALLLDRYDDVERVASRLPYISAFSAGSG
jgi:3-isopropylmalate/(R)-2-methylmalate dehydratase small subunit